MNVTKRTMHFGGSSPVAEFIGARTLELLASPNRIESYIVQDGLERRKLGFSGCTVLAKGPTLDELQIARLRECVLTPQAHYDGDPIFRRLPPKPSFAFRATSTCSTFWSICTIPAGSFIAARKSTEIGIGLAASWLVWPKNCFRSLRHQAQKRYGKRARLKLFKTKRATSFEQSTYCASEYSASNRHADRVLKLFFRVWLRTDYSMS